MSTRRRFHRLFREATLAALAAQGAACASDQVGIDRGRFDLPVCNAELSFDPLTGANLPNPVDYVVLRHAWVVDRSFTQISISAAAGSKCSGATDPASCATRFDALPIDQGWSYLGSHLAYTRGDEVGVVTTLEELKAFLGPIDTPGEAALFATESLQDAYYYVACELDPSARVVPGGFEVIAREGSTCGAGLSLDEHRLFVSTDGTVQDRETALVAVGDPNCSIGRLTEGVSLGRPRATSALGARLARIASLEAAAVKAFERLERELRSFGAPSSLSERAARAARDEVRHARRMGALARRFGGVTSEPSCETLPVRDVLDVALENAAEGCVRETYGALVGTYQAERVADPELGRVLRGIARDETGHAALSWDVADFLSSRLPAAERARVEERRRAAARRLRASLATQTVHDADRVLGVPEREIALALFDRVAPELFA